MGLIELAVIFFFIAILAMVLGAQGVAGITVEIGKWLLIAAVVFLLIAIVFGGHHFFGYTYP